MTHQWSIPDHAWLADSRWTCARCGADVKWFVDTGSAPPCTGAWWPWTAARREAFVAKARTAVPSP